MRTKGKDVVLRRGGRHANFEFWESYDQGKRGSKTDLSRAGFP